ncbi:MAG: hypothetical protein ACJ735_05195 [Actinomycetes bacterium]
MTRDGRPLIPAQLDAAAFQRLADIAGVLPVPETSSDWYDAVLEPTGETAS